MMGKSNFCSFYKNVCSSTRRGLCRATKPAGKLTMNSTNQFGRKSISLCFHRPQGCQTPAFVGKLETIARPSVSLFSDHRSASRQSCRVKGVAVSGGKGENGDHEGKKEKHKAKAKEEQAHQSKEQSKVDKRWRAGEHHDMMTPDQAVLPVANSYNNLTGIEKCRMFLSEIGMNATEIEELIHNFNVTKYMSWDYRHPLAPNKRELWDHRLSEYPCCHEYPNETVGEDYHSLSFENTRIVLLAHKEPKTCFGVHTGMYMLPLGGGFLVDHMIQNFQNSGIHRNIYVTTQYSSYYLNKRIHDKYSYREKGETAVKVIASHQTIESKEWLLSDVDCLQKNLGPLIDDEENSGLSPADEFIICTGNTVHDLDFRNLISFHRSRGSDLTVCATSVPKASLESDLSVDFSNRLVAYKDPNFESFHSKMGRTMKNIGIFVFNTNSLQRLLEVMDENDDFVGKAFGERMNVNVYTHSRYWHNLETLKDYHTVILDLLGGCMKNGHHFPIPNNFPSPRFMGKNLLQKSFIGCGTYLAGDCSIKNSFIGNNVILGRNVEISDSVLMHCHHCINEQQAFHEGMTITSPMFDRVEDLVTTVIGDNVTIDNCVVDENVHIGSGSLVINLNNVTEGGEEGSFFIHEGIIYLSKNCNLPENTVI